MSTSELLAARPRLSVAMIVRDAQQPLEETLSCLGSLADEVVILDTGSTDETKQVARSHSATVHERPWDDDFSAARNHCLSHVSGDWVLWLDAGERIAAEAAGHLRDFIDNYAEKSKAYLLNVKLPRSNSNIAAEQIARIRLVPNHPAVKFHGRIRETLALSLQDAELSAELLPWLIDRGQREHDLPTKVRKARRNMRLVDLEILQQEPQAYLLNCLGDAHHTLGDRKGAARKFREAIQAGQRGSVDMLEAYYGLLMSLDGEPNARKAQLAVCLEALKIFPLDAQLLCAMGGYLQADGRIDLAARAYQAAYNHGQVNPLTWHLDEITEVAAVCYSVSLQLQQKEDQAVQILQEALEEKPASLRIRRHLLDLQVKHGRLDQSLAILEKMSADTPNIEALRSAVRGACFATQQNWISALAYLDTAFTAGCRDPLCLRWLSISLLQTRDLQRAKLILDEWRAIEPGSVEPAKYLELLNGNAKSAAADRSDAANGQASQSESPQQKFRIDAGDLATEREISPISSPTTVGTPSLNESS